jgi:hypothetical protein
LNNFAGISVPRRFRLFACTAVLAAAALTACGGGVATTPLSGPIPSPGPTATPTPAPTAPPGPLTLSATTLAFPALGAANAAQLTISEANFHGNFNVSGCSAPALVTVAPALGSGPSFVTTVTPASGGTCTLLVADGHGGSANVAVTVNSAIHVSAPSLTFAAVGPANLQSLTASEPGFSGTFTITGCSAPTIATVSPASGSGPSITTQVTPVSGGTCSLTILDGIGGSVAVPITVNTTVSATPSSLSFPGTGAAYVQTLTIAEPSFSGPFAVSGCAGIVTYAAAPGAGPSVTTPITPAAGGTCNLAVTDGVGGTTNVSVVVTTGSISVTSRPRQ